LFSFVFLSSTWSIISSWLAIPFSPKALIALTAVIAIAIIVQNTPKAPKVGITKNIPIHTKTIPTIKPNVDALLLGFILTFIIIPPIH